MIRVAAADAGGRLGAEAGGGAWTLSVAGVAARSWPHAATPRTAAASATAVGPRMGRSSQHDRVVANARIASAEMSVAVRPARADELGPVAAALRAAGLGANVGRLLEFPYGSDSGEVLVAVNDA